MSRIYIIVALTQLAVNLMVEYGTLTIRRRLPVHLLARAAAALACLGCYAILWRLDLLHFYLLRSLATLPFLACCIFLFAETAAQKTFLYFMDFSITSFIATACRWVAARLPLSGGEDYLASALYVLVMALVVPLYLRRLRPRVRQMLYLFRRSNPLYAAFPVLSFAFFALVFGPVNVDASLDWFGTMMLYVALISLTYGILFSHFMVVYDQLQAENAVARSTRQLSLQKKYYEEVHKGLQAQDKLLHDSRHHLVAIAGLAQAGDTPAIGHYVQGLLDRGPVADTPVYCPHVVLNAVIGGYVSLARQQGIALSTQLDVPADLPMNEYELCVFFGNALENAVEACGRIPPGLDLFQRRFINLRARLDSGRLIVRVENSFHDDPARSGPGFPSSKGSGIGLESLRAVADAHEGSLACERRGEVFVLSAVLAVPGGS